MKKINLLPKPTFLAQHKRLLASGSIVILIAVSLYGLSAYLTASQTAFDFTRFSSAEQSQLSKYSIHRLQMVGYLSKTDSNTPCQSVSLIQSPDGQIVMLKVGDMLGSECLEVMTIKPDSTYLADARQSEPIVLRITRPTHE